MRPWFVMGILSVVGTPALAAELTVTVEIPRLNVLAYHAPYVAMWIERPDQSVAATLAVWYAVRREHDEGAQWLKELREWWRRSGRRLSTPIDGVTGPTRTPGRHELALDKAQATALAPGSYRLVVEAAREVGDREVLRVPFTWPGSASRSTSAQGTGELGRVVLSIRP